MPFELFPVSRSADRGKRKRERGENADHDSAAAAASVAVDLKESVADRGKEADTATDEEVEEFFAILKRLHAATKYIEKIDGASSLLMGKRLKTTKASAEEADEVGIRADRIPEHKLERNLDLDLNLEPASVASDGKERRSRSHNLKPLSVDSAVDSRRK